MAIRRRYTRPSRRINRNLSAVWSLATPDEVAHGVRWYREANATARELADRCGATLAQAVGVIAAISPGSRWEKNLEDAEALLAAYAYAEPLPMVGTYGRRNVLKAQAILRGAAPLDVLGGFKVRAFYANILSPDTPGPVTVDRHARGAAYQLRGDAAAEVRSDAEYRYLADHFARGARRVGLLPHEYQATLWVTWRRLGASTAPEVPF